MPSVELAHISHFMMHCQNLSLGSPFRSFPPFHFVFSSLFLNLLTVFHIAIHSDMLYVFLYVRVVCQMRTMLLCTCTFVLHIVLCYRSYEYATSILSHPVSQGQIWRRPQQVNPQISLQLIHIFSKYLYKHLLYFKCNSRYLGCIKKQNR